jgi:hypothetical protein
MSIKPIGSGGPSPLDSVETNVGTSATRSTVFSSSVEGTGGASAASKTPVETAVDEVAREVAAGRVGKGTEAVDTVIARMVELKAPAGTSKAALRERVSEVQAALGDDPVFAARVERMLARAISAARVE